MRFINNSNGSVNLSFVLFLVVFIFLIILAIAYTAWGFFNNAFQSLPDSVLHDGTREQINDLGNIFLNVDNLVPYFLIALWIATIISSIKVKPEHPALFLIAAGQLFLYTIVLVVLTDLGISIFDDTIIADFVSNLKSTNFIIHKFHLIGFFMLLISAVILHSRTQKEATDLIQ